MDKFPDTFKPESFPKPSEPSIDDDEMRTHLALVRSRIVSVVETCYRRYMPVAAFFISRAGDVTIANGEADLVAMNQRDYNQSPESRERFISATKKRNDFAIEKIGAELTQRFGAKFQTLHETSWDSECYRFYPVTKERPACRMCQITLWND